MNQPVSSFGGSSYGGRGPASLSSKNGWLLWLFLSLLLSMASGLVVVWLSIECSDSAYRISQQQAEMKRQSDHTVKLEVERERLLRPDELGRKAVELGMREAKPGQIRRLTLPPVASKETR